MLNFLKTSMSLQSNIIVTYKITEGIKFQSASDAKLIANAWLLRQQNRKKDEEGFGSLCQKAIGNPTYALALLREMCQAADGRDVGGNRLLSKKLLIMIEGAEAIIPLESLGQLSDSDRIRIQICLDWFKDPDFNESRDAVLLITESKSMINSAISRLTNIVEIAVLSPDEEKRAHFIQWFNKKQDRSHRLSSPKVEKDLARDTAGLNILALRKLLKKAAHAGGEICQKDVATEVQWFIERELGDIVEFKTPGHSLKDVVGFSQIKDYVNKKVIPRFKSTGKDSLPGLAVCGPIGAGKTFFWEAVAAESGMIVLVLARLRDKWYGESDVRLERLRRMLYTFVNVLVFIDEADAQFTSLNDRDQHATEKRLQAGLLSMMSDPLLRGKVKWLLLTARIDKLSQDMLRPGRPGSLVIPMLDPEGQDREDFLRWAIEPTLGRDVSSEVTNELRELSKDYFAAMFSELKSELYAEAVGKKLGIEEVKAIMQDIIQPAVGQTREYQTLCAKIFCNRKSLLPGTVDREGWLQKLQSLKTGGIG